MLCYHNRTDVDNGVGKALNPLLDTDLVKPPQIVERGLEEHRLVSGDVLGKSRILGSGDRGLPADFVYGKASLVKVRLACSLFDAVEPASSSLPHQHSGRGGVLVWAFLLPAC